jgi:hypothetical protein
MRMPSAAIAEANFDFADMARTTLDDHWRKIAPPGGMLTRRFVLINHGGVASSWRDHQIPADQGERDGVTRLHRLFFLQARIVARNASPGGGLCCDVSLLPILKWAAHF